MQRMTEEERKRMLAERPQFVPPRHPLWDGWIAVLDMAVRALTLGRGRVVATGRRAPIRWDGIIW